MKDLLKKFEDKKPEVVFHWSDPETEAEGWTVINSLRGGAAGGGTRMRKGLDMNEVLSLAKTMEVKFTVAGPAIGGAKSGINFDPADPRKEGVLRRWYKAVFPLLKNYYGTGGDLNVDQMHEVIPITSEYGLLHPQEGVFNGHFNATEDQKMNRINQLRQGVSKEVTHPDYTPNADGKIAVGDLITGFGVAEAARHFYDVYGDSIQGKKVIVQGFGNVGAAAAYYFAQMGAKLVGIIDRNGGILNPEGYSFEEVKELFLNKNGNTLVADQMIPFNEINEKIWSIGAQVFAPCAASRLIQKDQIDAMINAGLETITCGANVPFADKEIFFGPIMEYVDSKISLIPDFISNCGMARVFAYLMEKEVSIIDKEIFEDTSETIKKAIENVHAINPNKTNISAAAFETALKQLV